MTISAAEAHSTPLTTDDALLTRLQSLLGSACVRRLWLFYLDEDDRQLPTITPVDEHPANPGGGAAEHLASVIAEVVEQLGAASVVIVWERRLGRAGVPADRLWASAMTTACRDAGVALRGQYLCHNEGVRELTPAERGVDRAD